MPDGVYLLKDVEDYLDGVNERPRLIFTSPPFSLDLGHERWLGDIFARLADLIREDGSIVVTLGNCWAPPRQTTDTFRLLEAIAQYTGLDLLQMFVLVHDLPRMSSSVAVEMAGLQRAPDHVSYAWWLGRSDKVVTTAPKTFNSNVVPVSPSPRERIWLEAQGYHAALPVDAPGWFIHHLTDPGDLVLDPFAGLNATGCAARHLGRRWLSLDTDKQMIAKALSRPSPDVDWPA
jgi:site-specific DNA-methyltransferase (cytosine-N4-specific)